MYKCDKVLQVSVGLRVDPRTAALVCALHRRVLLNLCMWRTRAFKLPAMCTRCVSACSLGHISVCVRTDPTDGAGVQGPPTRGGCPHMQPCAHRGLHTPGPGAWRCRGDSRARRGSRDSVLDSCRSPPPRPLRPSRPRGAPGTCGRPGGTRVAVLEVPSGPLGAGCTRPLLGPLGWRVPGSRCLRACRRRMPRARGGTVHAPTPTPAGRGVPDWARFPGVSGGSGCATPGRCQALARAPARGTALCVGGHGCSTCPGFTVDLGCGCSSTCPWRSATACTRLCSCSGCQPSAGQGSGVTVSCRQHCGPGQGQVAAEGDDLWCRVIPRVLCQEPAVPRSASGTALGVSGTVQCPGCRAGGGTQYPRPGATAWAASVSQSKVQQLPPPRLPVPRPCSPDSLSQ